jgi:hypothetical protein
MSVIGPRDLPEHCPGCGRHGERDHAADGDRWGCQDDDCRVVSYTEASA